MFQKDLKRVTAKPLNISEVEKYLAGVKSVALAAFPNMPPVTQHVEDAGTDWTDQHGSVCPDCWHSDLNILSVSELDSAAKLRLRDRSVPVWSNPQILSGD